MPSRSLGGGGVRGKGANFLGFRDAVRTLFGEETWLRVLAEASGDVRSLMAGTELKSGAWYPVQTYQDLHAAAAAALPEEADLARRIGHAAMRSDLSGIYRVFTYFLSPHSLMARAVPIFATYWEHVDMDLARVDHTHVRVEVQGARGFDAAIWSDVAGGIEACLEESGASDIVIEVVERNLELGETLWDVRWCVLV